MRILILAGGEQKRWANYRGVPKHLVKLAGERLLDRTVRLVKERQPRADIRVVVRDMDDERYKVPGTKRAPARLNPDIKDGDKFASSRHLWSKSSRTVILYGDVWFSSAAMDAILSDDPHPDGWMFFGRFGASETAPGGECFAFVLDPEALEHASGQLDRIIEKRLDGSIWRNGGWEWYRALCSLPDSRLLDHRDHGHSTLIDDWTEDMDTAQDWDRWCWRWAHSSEERRQAHL